MTGTGTAAEEGSVRHVIRPRDIRGRRGLLCQFLNHLIAFVCQVRPSWSIITQSYHNASSLRDLRGEYQVQF